jgi:hypothetical protein
MLNKERGGDAAFFYARVFLPLIQSRERAASLRCSALERRTGHFAIKSRQNRLIA